MQNPGSLFSPRQLAAYQNHPSIRQVCIAVPNLSEYIVYKPRNIPLASSGVSNTAFITMSAPGGAPSPAPRGGSMGPGANGGSMPMSQQQMSGQPVHSAPPPGPPPPQSGAMSQQNLNQIVSIISCLCTAGYALSRRIVIIFLWSCFLHFGRPSSWESGGGGQLCPCRCQCFLATGRERTHPT